MKKIGNWPITEANTDFSKISTKSEQNFDEFWSFEFYERSLWHCRFDRTLSYSAKGSAHKTPKLQNSSKFCSDLVDILEKLVSASVIGRLPIFFMTKQSF